MGADRRKGDSRRRWAGSVGIVALLIAAIVLGSRAVRPAPTVPAAANFFPPTAVATPPVASAESRAGRGGESPRLWLFYGGHDQLQRLDLDSGEHEFIGMRARPLLVTGSELVIATVDHPLIGWASLEEPTEMPDGWRDAVVAGADEPGAIWLGTNETATWKLAHIARMREGETVTFPVGIDLAAQPARAQGVLHAGRDLATVQGQIYEYTSDGWHQVLPGWLAGYTENAALVEQCRTLTSCEQRWFARPQWQLLDAAPDLETAIIEFGVGPVVTEMIGAAESDWAALGSGPDELRALADLDEADYSLCCDQRWLAVRIAERVVLFDTAAGEVWAAYDGLVVEDGGRVLLAQKPG